MRQFKANTIFRRGPDIDLNACVGDNGGPYDYFDYALGYFKAAKVLLRAVEGRTLEVDLAVYPMAFAYRHAVELSLKHFIILLPPLLSSAERPKATHRLTDNWKLLRPYIAENKAFEPESTLAPFEQTIADIEHFDPTGEVFRFPEDRSGSRHLADASIINLGVLGESLEQAKDIVECWNEIADRLREDYNWSH